MSDSGFWDEGYAVIDCLLGPADIRLVESAMDFSAHRNSMTKRQEGCVDKASDEYSPLAGEVLLRRCRPAFETVVGKPLLEGHAYWRIYRNGGLLKKHMDRPSCEISASVPIRATPADAIWPIEIEDIQGRHRSIELRPGSALLYQGHRIPHWREPFAGSEQLQLLFHYVLKDGAFADLQYDERDGDPLIRTEIS